MEAEADVRAYEALAQHPRLGDLAAVARRVTEDAVQARRLEPSPARVQTLAEELGLSREDASTAFGNALDVLGRDPEDDAERALARALAAHVVSSKPPQGEEAEHRVAGDLLWLATQTPFDATGLLDRALGGAAEALWDAVAERVRSIDQGKEPTLGRGEALVGALALQASKSKAAEAKARGLAAEVRDPRVARILAARSTARDGAPELTGQRVPAPRGAVATAILAVTGILLLLHVARFVGRLVLGYRTPATAKLAEDGGMRVAWRSELLGRTLRDGEFVIPRSGLARATREVRYPSLATYAGLVALAGGSYLGVTAFVDGARAASPSLLATGLVIVVLGLAIDFALTSLGPGARGRCRLLLVSRDGARVCVGDVDAKAADTLLARLLQG